MTVGMVRIAKPRWRWLQRGVECLFWAAVMLGSVGPGVARAVQAPVISLHAFVAAKRHARLPDGIDLA